MSHLKSCRSPPALIECRPVSHESCSLHDTGWSHPDHQGRLPALTRAVYRDMVALYEPLLQVEGVPATEAVNLVKKYLAGQKVKAEVEFSWGATEAKAGTLVDASRPLSAP